MSYDKNIVGKTTMNYDDKVKVRKQARAYNRMREILKSSEEYFGEEKYTTSKGLLANYKEKLKIFTELKGEEDISEFERRAENLKLQLNETDVIKKIATLKSIMGNLHLSESCFEKGEYKNSTDFLIRYQKKRNSYQEIGGKEYISYFGRRAENLESKLKELGKI